jgi:hypothetical protein
MSGRDALPLPLIDEAEALLEDLNDKFALVQTDSRISILDVRGTERAGSGLRLLSKSDFVTFLANRAAPGKTKQNAAHWWLQHPRRREFAGIVFSPSGAAEDYYNLWRGFAVQPSIGDCGLFWDLVSQVLCAGNDEMYLYVRRWLAHLFQRTGELPETALVLRGKQGTGKTTFTDAIGHLVGERHYLSVTNMMQVTGRFNGHLARLVLLCANEAIWGGNKGDEGNLKAMITDRSTAIEQKGKDVVQLANYKRLIVCSNNEWAVPMDYDDRRFLVLDVDDCRKEDGAYFSALHAQLKAGGYGALMQSLMDEDLNGFNPRQLPRTGAGLDIKLKSGTALVRWLFEHLNAGRNHDPARNVRELKMASDTAWRPMVPKEQVYDSYLEFCEKQNERRPDAESQFFKNIRQILPGVRDVRPAVPEGLVRARYLAYPPLAECRRHFESHVKQEGCIAWEAGD